MGRARLMEQQRKRREALKATRKAAAAKAAKSADMISKYGSGSKKGVTRDPSKDASKTPLVLAPKSDNKPKASPKASTSSPKASPKPFAPKAKAKPSEAASKRFYSSSSQGEIAKKLNKEKAKSNFFAGGKGGKYDKQLETSSVFNRRGRQTGTKTVEKKKETPKKKPTYNRRGRRVG